MKVRLEGTREECGDMVRDMEWRYSVISVSEFYPNRNWENIGRMYLEVLQSKQNERTAKEKGEKQ